MLKNNGKNKLLEYFNLNSYQELIDYIKENPEDSKVKEIKDLFKLSGIDLDSEVDRDE